uniref:Transmembrane and coiled-coil domains 4 n=1 Tax=Electrophorus electricus TaxID=8005 RepID=A0A4W4G0D8_ELEEL
RLTWTVAHFSQPFMLAVPGVPIGKQLTEPGRFAYAALCGVSLGQLFPGSEQRTFREQYLEGIVQWLGLDDSVMPVMQAFLAGLGCEGSDTFLSILQAEPLLSTGVLRVIQVFFIVLWFCGDEHERRLHVSVCLCVQGVTGGLAAPLVAAGAGAVLGAGGAAVLGSAAGIAIMASLFGAAGAGLAGYKMNKRVGAIEEFEFLPMSPGKHLHLTVAVTGWLSSGKYSSFQAPWSSLGACGEQYCLKWESRYLRDLGSVLDSLWDGLVSIVAQEALKYTVLSGIVTALTWPASLLAVASVIDNPWGVCLSRSAEVGKHLAQVLRSRQQGKRPVSLIGFSLGARVIYFCLEELANDQGSEGVIEDVVLLGAPVDGSEKTWERISRVVAGKIINGYCRGDWLLGFLYRSSAVQLSVAGLQPISSKSHRIINVDLSSVVKGHLDYVHQMDTILVAVGVPTKEGAGTICGHPQSVVLARGKVDSPEMQSAKESGQKVENSITDSKETEEFSTKEDFRNTEGKECSAGTENEDGWDIPDISDLLDSLSDSNPVRKDSSSSRKSTDSQYQGKDRAEGSTDTEHVPWDWNTTHWTTEHTNHPT